MNVENIKYAIYNIIDNNFLVLIEDDYGNMVEEFETRSFIDDLSELVTFNSKGEAWEKTPIGCTVVSVRVN